jgi:hypothetical protein
LTQPGVVVAALWIPDPELDEYPSVCASAPETSRFWIGASEA